MSIRVLSWVFDRSTVTHRGDLLVLLVLADHAHDDGSSAYPSVETIARKARLSRRGAQLALRRLVKHEAITPTGKGPRGTITYTVLMPEGAQPLRSEVPARANSATQGGELSDPQGANSPAPEPSLEPSVEPSSLAPNESKGREREAQVIQFNTRDLPRPGSKAAVA